MPVPPKTLARVDKLLRLAADTSTTDGERAVAAIEAARLIRENSLVVTESIKTKRIKKPKTSSTKNSSDSRSEPNTKSTPSPTPTPSSTWKSVVTLKNGNCGYCGKAFHSGDIVCVDTDNGSMICRDWSCVDD